MKEKNINLPSGFTPFELLSGASPRTPMLIALSGGADSRMLFELASRHCAAHGTRFYACHVNHGIRGEEATRDRDFCVRLASECQYCADIFVLNADVPALAEKWGKSIELAARTVRYDFFATVMKEHSIPVLVTAHNSDDNLETVIFNLTRGTGVKGMRGIPPSRPIDGGVLIRPMLGIPKSAVLEFCRDNGLDYVTDSTNTDTDYTRNLIRAEIVPLLERINPGVRGSVARLTRSMSELWEYTETEAATYLDGDGRLILSRLSEAPASLAPYVVALAAERSGAELEGVHTDALVRLCAKAKDGSSVSLPASLRGVVRGDRLCFERDSRFPDDTWELDIPLTEGTTSFKDGSISAEKTDDGLKIAMSLSPNQEKCLNSINVYKLDIKAYIIFDTIIRSEKALRLRTRKKGDRILSGGVHKSVKKLMCDKKLPVVTRDRLPMLCAGDDILWIPGVATADGVKCKYL